MITCDGGRCTVEGPLTLENIVAVLEESQRELPAAEQVVVDLGGVTEVDSSAVSLLLEWRRAALRDKRKLEFANLPDNLKSLAQLYGVTELLDGK
ncbi:MAG: STAS domain-containing protein [Betaproteobacteria bacterium]|nr:STAS domain-containing protein [Betaproteobacteria bacterium]